MVTRAPKISTSMPWQEIAGYHPRRIQEYQIENFECVEGLLVDDGPKPPLTVRKASIPFRFYIPRGANLDRLAYRVWGMVKANQSLMDVLLSP